MCMQDNTSRREIVRDFFVGFVIGLLAIVACDVFRQRVEPPQNSDDDSTPGRQLIRDGGYDFIEEYNHERPYGSTRRELNDELTRRRESKDQ